MYSQIFKHLFSYYFKTIIFFHLGILVLIYMADFTENLKKLGEYNPSMADIFLISALKLPNLITELSPFLILFASLFAIRSLALKKEIDIFKAAGLSIWQFLHPFFVSISLYSAIIIFGVNSLAVFSNNYVEKLENIITKKDNNTLYVNDNILWIIDRINKFNKNIIMAKGFEALGKKWNLVDVKILKVENNVLVAIYQSKTAVINSNQLILNDVIVKTKDEKFISSQNQVIIALNTKSSNINNLMADPDRINIFLYPIYLYNLKQLGLDSSAYETYFYNLLTLPILFFGMLLLSTFFCISDSRRGKNLYIITATIVGGFIFYFTINFIVAIASTGHIPIYVSIIFSKLLVLSISAYMVIKKEGV